jgi:two-component system sensor histidine kinase PilS (NtrC family)
VTTAEANLSAMLPQTADSGAAPAFVDGRPWEPLLLYASYRVLLAGLFAGLYFSRLGPSLLGSFDPTLFALCSIGYLVVAALGLALVTRRKPDFGIQVTLLLLIDIAALTLLMHASGGLPSGLGTLLAIPVAAGGVLLAGEMALLYAALATLSMLGEQMFAQWFNLFGDTHYTQAGIHGTVFFATALVARWLAGHLRQSEAIAAQRGLDLANLAQLNDYIIRRLQSGVIVVDATAKIRLVNTSARTLLGLPEHEQPIALDDLSPELAERLAAWRQDPTAETGILRMTDIGTDILPRFARLGASADSGTLIFLDDSSSVMRQMVQMKQASLGRLTGSIAHEIRNPLGAISHAAQLLGESDALPPGDARLIEIIRQHTGRVNEIIESVMQLSRRSGSRPETLRLGPAVAHFISEFSRSEGIDAGRLRAEIEPADTSIRFDPVQLQQILWNLCSNALRYGRPAHGPAVVELRGGLGHGIRGPYLEVVDQGPGIDAATAQQIFEPFFTTDSRGSGLGLYIARALCEHNFARLDYLEPAAGGSCFRIRFAELTQPDAQP